MIRRPIFMGGGGGGGEGVTTTSSHAGRAVVSSRCSGAISPARHASSLMEPGSRPRPMKATAAVAQAATIVVAANRNQSGVAAGARWQGRQQRRR